tara:strand:- start:8830 stop:9549 length:720 start_codon:yes stop_codon:yes gene_type:complete
MKNIMTSQNVYNNINKIPNPTMPAPASAPAVNANHSLIFFTGGSNFFDSNIYSEFISNLQNHSIDIYDVPYKSTINQSFIDSLKPKYKTVNLLGHSSGCTTLFNQCNYKNIDNVFLLDPVNTDLKRQKSKYNISNYKSVSFIYALKSYKITYNPFGLPFIPIFKLIPENLNNPDNKCKIYKKKIENYGHSDILNEKYSNFMHFTRISVGNKNRSKKTKKKYFNIIGKYIAFLNNNKISI